MDEFEPYSSPHLEPRHSRLSMKVDRRPLLDDDDIDATSLGRGCQGDAYSAVHFASVRSMASKRRRSLTVMLLVVITVILTLSVVLLIVPGLLYLQKHSEHNNHVTETVSLQEMCVSKCVSEAAPAIMDAEAENIVNANATLHLTCRASCTSIHGTTP